MNRARAPRGDNDSSGKRRKPNTAQVAIILGIAAGMASMREGWEAAKAGIPLNIYAESHPALKRALVHFSNL